jgi:branched-subunit amino acid transport protein
MTWGLVLGLAAGAYFFKVLGMVIIGGRALPARLERCLALIPAAVVAALIAGDTVATGHHLQVDARLAGVGAAVVAASRKLPVVVVIVIGAAVTAGIRLLAG